MAGMIEHVNITVADPDAAAERMAELFDWKVRWSGPSLLGGRTVHVGSETSYLALYTRTPGQPAVQFEKGVPLNHVGVLVDDLDAVEARVIGMGFTPFSHGDYQPGRRFYFFDENGIEFECVSYSALG